MLKKPMLGLPSWNWSPRSKQVFGDARCHWASFAALQRSGDQPAPCGERFEFLLLVCPGAVIKLSRQAGCSALSAMRQDCPGMAGSTSRKRGTAGKRGKKRERTSMANCSAERRAPTRGIQPAKHFHLLLSIPTSAARAPSDPRLLDQLPSLSLPSRLRPPNLRSARHQSTTPQRNTEPLHLASACA